MIISASRRTDIPAFHAEWFMERVRAGFADVRNPFNARQISRVSLDRDEAELIVFWTKDATGMLEHLDELDGRGMRYLFQYTLTPYGADVEPHVDKRRAVETLLKLSARIGAERVIWRYDPILLAERWTAEWHVKLFEAMCRRLEGASGRCVVSFVDLYASVRRTASWIHAPSESQMHEMAREMAKIARKHGFLPSACAETIDLTGDGLEARGCIDRADVERVLGAPVCAAKDAGQRSACRCVSSVDIGAYDTCRHGCAYCYASHGRPIEPCDRYATLLGRPLSGGERIVERRAARAAEAQRSFID